MYKSDAIKKNIPVRKMLALNKRKTAGVTQPRLSRIKRTFHGSFPLSCSIACVSNTSYINKPCIRTFYASNVTYKTLINNNI